MKLSEIAQQLSWEAKAAAGRLDVEVTGAYACDLLSYVMANARAGELWITVQGHPNIIAVASLINLAGVVVVEGAKIEPATVEKAEQEGVPLLATSEAAYTMAGRLYALGVRRSD